MRLLPYRRFELQSPLSVTQVTQALSDSGEPKRWIRLGTADRPFEGTVTASGFQIQRNISYRNSFLPQVTGTVTPEGSGSRISITMKLHSVVLIFLLVWSGVLASICVAVGVSFIAGSVEGTAALAPFGLFLLASLVITGSFAYEARKATELLTSLLRATPAAAQPGAMQWS